mmetsp:Transcript_24309/g.65732  ORF Transcript_24309/g.65732 Transcript_24309/m.65732 type:complete len:223 (+) Transcript_24309:3522-4190(+)
MAASLPSQRRTRATHSSSTTGRTVSSRPRCPRARTRSSHWRSLPTRSNCSRLAWTTSPCGISAASFSSLSAASSATFPCRLCSRRCGCPTLMLAVKMRIRQWQMVQQSWARLTARSTSSTAGVWATSWAKSTRRPSPPCTPTRRSRPRRARPLAFAPAARTARSSCWPPTCRSCQRLTCATQCTASSSGLSRALASTKMGAKSLRQRPAPKSSSSPPKTSPT